MNQHDEDIIYRTAMQAAMICGVDAAEVDRLLLLFNSTRFVDEPMRCNHPHIQALKQNVRWAFEDATAEGKLLTLTGAVKL